MTQDTKFANDVIEAPPPTLPQSETNDTAPKLTREKSQIPKIFQSIRNIVGDVAGIFRGSISDLDILAHQPVEEQRRPARGMTRREAFRRGAAVIGASLVLAACGDLATPPQVPPPTPPVTPPDQEKVEALRPLTPEELAEIKPLIDAHEEFFKAIGVAFESPRFEDGTDYITVLVNAAKQGATPEYLALKEGWAEKSKTGQEMLEAAKANIASWEIESDLIGYERATGERPFYNIAYVTPFRTLVELSKVKFTNSDISGAAAYYRIGNRSMLMGELPLEFGFNLGTLSHELEHAVQWQVEPHKQNKTFAEFNEYLITRMQNVKGLYEAYLAIPEPELDAQLGGVLVSYIGYDDFPKYAAVAKEYKLDTDTDDTEVIVQRILKFAQEQRKTNPDFLADPANKDFVELYYKTIDSLNHETVSLPIQFLIDDETNYQADGVTLTEIGKYRKALLEATLYEISYEAGSDHMMTFEEFAKLQEEADKAYPEERTYAERKAILEKSGLKSIGTGEDLNIEFYKFPDVNSSKLRVYIALKDDALASEKGVLVEIPGYQNAEVTSVESAGEEGKYIIRLADGQTAPLELKRGTTASQTGGYPRIYGKTVSSTDVNEAQVLGYGETPENIKVIKGKQAFTNKPAFQIQMQGINFLEDSLTFISETGTDTNIPDLMNSIYFPGERPFLLTPQGTLFENEYNTYDGSVRAAELAQILTEMNAKPVDQAAYDKMMSEEPYTIRTRITYEQSTVDGETILTPYLTMQIIPGGQPVEIRLQKAN